MGFVSMSALLFISAVLCYSAAAKLINVQVKRIVDVKSTIAISRTAIRMKNTGEDPLNHFYVAVHANEAPGLGDIWVSEPSSDKLLRALEMEPYNDLSGLESGAKGFKVIFAKPLAGGGEVVVDLRMDVADVIKPVPDVIENYDAQYMRYVGNSYFYTPYETKEMTTSITLGSSTVTSQHGVEKPFEIAKDKVTLGPHNDVPPLSHNEIKFRYKNDRGFLVANSAVKEFYVNHLGEIAVKEEFKVTNAGAKHEGEWSRVDHSSGLSSKYSTALGDVWANLPMDAKRVQYKDLIGNITTSRLRRPSKGKRQIQLVYRYPLMSGWQNHFWINYEIVLARYLQSSGSEHELTLPLFPSLNTDLFCKEFEFHVFLPEWSHSIEVTKHDSLPIEAELTSERTTLTMLGRPVVSFKLRMVRSQSKHARTVTIKYSYNTGLAWIMPGLVALGIFCIIAGFMICVRTGLDVVSEKDEIAMQKAKVKSQ